jgi:hypothetical protein
MTKYERFMAGESFIHPILGVYAHHRYITETSTKDLGSICQVAFLGDHVGNIEKITKTRVFIYSYWLNKRLAAKLMIEDMDFDIEVDKAGRTTKK